MPRRKPSLERVRFSSPVIDELQRLVFYELANAREWNRETIKHEPRGANRWKFSSGSHGAAKTIAWSIEFDGRYIIVTSEYSTFSLRQGFTFDMGNGRIIIDGQAGETRDGEPAPKPEVLGPSGERGPEV